MKCCRPFVLILCLLSFAALAADNRKDSKSGRDSKGHADFKFDGVWKPKGAILGGTFFPPPALESITLTIKKGRYEVTVKGEDHSDTGTYTLDATTTPKRMTIKSESGPNKGKTILAIYEIKNADAMRVCYDLSGKEFPKDFKAPKNMERYLVGYRRQVSKAPGADKPSGK